MIACRRAPGGLQSVMTTPITFRPGKKAPVFPKGLRTLDAYLTPFSTTELPTSVPVPTEGDWNMDGNDTYGDCTIAAVEHSIKVFNTDSGLSLFDPTSDQVITEYFTETGGPDAGLVISDVLYKWRNGGLFQPAPGGPSKVWGYVSSHADAASLKKGVFLFGAVYVGAQLPYDAEDQFNNDQTWTWTAQQASQQSLGGHAFIIVGYDTQWFYGVSWGQVVKIDPKWLTAYVDEVWNVLSVQFVQAGHDGLDAATLEADLDGVTPPPAPKPVPPPPPTPPSPPTPTPPTPVPPAPPAPSPSWWSQFLQWLLGFFGVGAK